VKTHEKIDRQIGAYLAIAYCYHPGSPSNFNEKKKHILAHNLFVDPKSPTETLAYVRSCLVYFTPARAKARRVRLWDIEPIRDELLAWKHAAESRMGRRAAASRRT
jgi:hypothetical protein